jgi:hypothetical protein
MKKFLLILTLFFVSASVLHAQDEDTDGDNDKIRDKMTEFVQRRLNLNKNEAEKFSPVFLRYFKEWRTTLRNFKSDRLILQQKIVELRLRYRTEFKDIIGEKRSNEVYRQQEIFIQKVKDIREEQLRRRDPRNTRRTRSLTE